MRAEPRTLRDQDGVEVADPEAAPPDLAHHRAQEEERAAPAMARIGIGEARPEVLKTERPEQGVAGRVRQHVGVGMSLQARRAAQAHAPQDEPAAGRDRMLIPSASDPERNLVLPAPDRRRHGATPDALRPARGLRAPISHPAPPPSVPRPSPRSPSTPGSLPRDAGPPAS